MELLYCQKLLHYVNIEMEFAMAGFYGTRCIVCSEKFKKEDEIVVCPDCGTPYHRDCYIESGDCVNTVLHRTGRSWQPSYDVGDDASAYSEETECEKCGSKNPSLSLFCNQCGYPLSTLDAHYENFRKKEMSSQDKVINENPKEFNKNEYSNVNVNPYLINFSDRLCGYSADEDFDGVKLSELADYVGTNTHYYLPIFKRIRDTGRMMTWNFIAMIFPEIYFANRKMPLVALVMALIRFFVNIPYYIVGLSEMNVGALTEFALQFDMRSSAFQTLQTLFYFLTYGLMFLGGGFANWIYYKLTLKKIKNIKIKEDANDNISNLSVVLQKKGGTSALLMVLFICVYAMPYIIMSIFNSIPIFKMFL